MSCKNTHMYFNTYSKKNKNIHGHKILQVQDSVYISGERGNGLLGKAKFLLYRYVYFIYNI